MSPKRICNQGLGNNERVVEAADSIGRSWHKIVTLPVNSVYMTTPRLHQSTTWVYASPLKISGATKHRQKKLTVKISKEMINLTITPLYNQNEESTKIVKFCLHAREFHNFQFYLRFRKHRKQRFQNNAVVSFR